MRHIKAYQTGTAIQNDLDNRTIRQPYVAILPNDEIDYNTRQATFDGGGANVTTFRKVFDGGGAADTPSVPTGCLGGYADKFIIEGKTQLIEL